jgi:hypothetical protein
MVDGGPMNWDVSARRGAETRMVTTATMIRTGVPATLLADSVPAAGGGAS